MAFKIAEIAPSLNLSALKIALYGEEKVGKSSFCAGMESPIFLDVEEGTNFLNVSRINKNTLGVEEWTYDHVMSVLNEMLVQEHSFKALVLDSIDWIETLAMGKLKEEHPGAKSYLDSSIKALSYGGGTSMLQQYMKDIFDAVENIRRSRNMHVVIIAHTKKKTETDVQGASFDKSVLKLTEKTEGLCIEWADFILFAKNKVYTSTEEVGLKKRNIGSDGGRIILTAKNPSFSGGGRVELPEELPLEWAAFQAALKVAIKEVKAKAAIVAQPKTKKDDKPVTVTTTTTTIIED